MGTFRATPAPSFIPFTCPRPPPTAAFSRSSESASSSGSLFRVCSSARVKPWGVCLPPTQVPSPASPAPPTSGGALTLFPVPELSLSSRPPLPLSETARGPLRLSEPRGRPRIPAAEASVPARPRARGAAVRAEVGERVPADPSGSDAASLRPRASSLNICSVPRLVQPLVRGFAHRDRSGGSTVTAASRATATPCWGSPCPASWSAQPRQGTSRLDGASGSQVQARVGSPAAR